MQIQLFGSVRVCIGDVTLAARDFGGRKPKQLLEILLLAEGRPVSKDRLADQLWGEAPPVNAAAALEHYVSVLRKRLDGAGRPKQSIIVTEHGGYRFDLTRADLDTVAFDRFLDANASIGMTRSEIDAALELVRGELLEDEPYADWAAKARDYYRRRRTELLIAGAAAAIADADPRRAQSLAGMALDADPLAEEAHRHRMLACYLLGDQRAALGAFATCRARLADELGIDPMPETTELHQAILAQARPQTLVPRPARPVAITPVRAPHDQLAQASDHLPLLGRTVELATLVQACRPSAGSAFVAVEGGTGMGKTRVLDELAARLTGTGVVRVCCVDLEQQLGGAMLMNVVRALAADPAESGPVLDSLATADPLTGLSSVATLEQVGRFLTAHGPFVVLVDEAQWADAASVAALAYLRRHVHGATMVFAIRTDSSAVGAGLQRLEMDTRCLLTALTEDDLAPLDLPGLHEATDGLPLLVVEHVASAGNVAVRAAESSSDIIVQRFWRMEPGDRKLLQIASILAEPVGPEETARLLGAEPDDVVERLEELCDHDVLCLRGHGFAFRYPAVRRRIAGTVSPARRRMLRARYRGHEGPDRRRSNSTVAIERRVAGDDRRASQDLADAAS